MNNTEEILLFLMIILFINANDINLANNTTILLLFGLILFYNNGFNLCTNRCCGQF